MGEMTKRNQIIVLNIGSTSTKVAAFLNEKLIFSKNIDHTADELARYENIPHQLPFRKEAIMNALTEANINISKTDGFSAICTGLLPMPGGTYEVNDLMYKHGEMGIGSKHPGNLGPMLTLELARQFGARGFVVNPSSIDEFCDKARLTGFHEIVRTSRGHPLNQKEVAMRYANQNGKRYQDINLIVVHMGGGISICAHEKGKLIDGIDSTKGEGRMAPTRTGALPVALVVELCFSGKYTEKELLDKVQKTGGWVDLLGTSDGREVQKRISEGDEFAKFVYDTTAYQIAKDIGSCAAVLSGDVDAILLTGGLAYSEYFDNIIKQMTGFIAPIHVYPGEFEMDALAAGALRVLQGEEEALSYTGEPVFKGFPGKRQ